MEVKIEKLREVVRETTIKVYNPGAMDHQVSHRLKSIELSEDYTRIDFIIIGSYKYIDGGWIQIDRNSFIRAVGSDVKHHLIKAIGIPYAPQKHWFKKQGEFHTYSLIFPALPKGTTAIDIIEKEAPGTYFNFYNVPFDTWMTVTHPLDVQITSN